jgi:hypothetical protein
LEQIRKVLKRILALLTGRLARNIYFWTAVLLIRFSNFDYGYSVSELLYCFALLLPLFCGIYLNNLLLIPRFLEQRRYLLFFGINILVLLADTWYSLAILRQQLQHPEVSVFKTIWAPISKDALNEFPVLGVIHFLIHGFVFLVFALFWYASDYRKKKREIAEVRKQQTETELAFLKSQLNPHFLFNTLNNLYGLTLKNNGEASGALLQLSAILRYLLYESNTSRVPFQREQEIMQAYIELELLRLPEMDNVVFAIHADGDYLVPPLLWLPLLENLFKHSRYSPQATIEFRCNIQQGLLQLYACNSFEPAAPVTHGGIGMDNLRKRLQLLYPGRHEISLQQNDDLYIADIKIQLDESPSSTDRR